MIDPEDFLDRAKLRKMSRTRLAAAVVALARELKRVSG